MLTSQQKNKMFWTTVYLKFDPSRAALNINTGYREQSEHRSTKKNCWVDMKWGVWTQGWTYSLEAGPCFFCLSLKKNRSSDKKSYWESKNKLRKMADVVLKMDFPENGSHKKSNAPLQCWLVKLFFYQKFKILVVQIPTLKKIQIALKMKNIIIRNLAKIYRQWQSWLNPLKVKSWGRGGIHNSTGRVQGVDEGQPCGVCGTNGHVRPRQTIASGRDGRCGGPVSTDSIVGHRKPEANSSGEKKSRE